MTGRPSLKSHPQFGADSFRPRFQQRPAFKRSCALIAFPNKILTGPAALRQFPPVASQSDKRGAIIPDQGRVKGRAAPLNGSRVGLCKRSNLARARLRLQGASASNTEREKWGITRCDVPESPPTPPDTIPPAAFTLTRQHVASRQAL